MFFFPGGEGESQVKRCCVQLRWHSPLKAEAVAIFQGKGYSYQLCPSDLNLIFRETSVLYWCLCLSKAILEITACPSALLYTIDITPKKLALYSKRHVLIRMMENCKYRAWKKNTIFWEQPQDQNNFCSCCFSHLFPWELQAFIPIAMILLKMTVLRLSCE